MCIQCFFLVDKSLYTLLWKNGHFHEHKVAGKNIYANTLLLSRVMQRLPCYWDQPQPPHFAIKKGVKSNIKCQGLRGRESTLSIQSVYPGDSFSRRKQAHGVRWPQEAKKFVFPSLPAPFWTAYISLPGSTCPSHSLSRTQPISLCK